MHLSTLLSVAHTAHIPSRFNSALQAPGNQFEILYLAQNPLVALQEVGALYGSATSPGGIIANPVGTWVTFDLTVKLQHFADLTGPSEQSLIATNVQELTGDWRSYHLRSIHHTPWMPGPVAPAETQQLGEQLATDKWEGFLTASAKSAIYMNPILFPEDLWPGSYVEFYNPNSTTAERITGPVP